MQSRQISTRAYLTKCRISGGLGYGQKMLGVSVSRETLTPNAGYVVGILLRLATGHRESCAAPGLRVSCAARPAREALRPGAALAQLTRLPLGEHAGAKQR